MQVLFSFVGNRDPFVDGERDLGPVLSLLEEREFHRIYLFCTGDAYFERARMVEQEAAERFGVRGIQFVDVELESVIDYEEIFSKLKARVESILEKIDHRSPEISVLLDPGTPQMQTTWFLLVRSGVLDARLLQGVPPRFAAGVYRVKEVDLDGSTLPVFSFSPDAAASPPQPQAPEEAAGPVERSADGAGPRVLFQPAVREQDRWITSSGVELIGSSPAFAHALEYAGQVARYDLSVLIQGATGTGKGLVARYIHDRSPRHGGPFQSINCSAVPPSLAESEFFGAEKGAFTGADARRPGKLRAAAGGTVFLDEIGDLALDLQPKLLEVLEEQRVSPVGADHSEPLDVRVLAATNRDLEAMVDEGTFRMDLYQRLRQVELRLPSLRERTEDIPLLVRRFVDEWNAQYHEEKGLSEETLGYFARYPWPGNVRDLRNAVLSMCAAGRSRAIGPELMPVAMLKYFKREQARPELPVTIPEDGIDLKALLHRIEREYYEKAMEMADGNQARAADLLGVNPPAFRKAWRERFS